MDHSFRAINLLKQKMLTRVSLVNPTLAADIREINLPWYYIRDVKNQAEDTADDVPEETTAEVFIYDEIGGSMGVSADEFVQDLQAITADTITVRINSPGGSVFDSIAIYNALVQHPAFVRTRVDALAASGASIVAMAGDEVEVMVGGQIMIHDALGIEQGNAKEMREMAKFLDKQSDNIATIYAAKAGGELKDWRDLMLAETWMFAQEAVDMGLADKVYMRPAPVGAEETIPDEEPPNPDPAEEDDTEGDEPTDKDLENAMKRLHRLTNKGFKYSGRNRAPKPRTDIIRHGSDDDIDLENFLSKLK